MTDARTDWLLWRSGADTPDHPYPCLWTKGVL
jgi:hypothetical protein